MGDKKKSELFLPNVRKEKPRADAREELGESIVILKFLHSAGFSIHLSVEKAISSETQ